MNVASKTSMVLTGLAVIFTGMAVAFWTKDPSAKPLPDIPLVDSTLLPPTTFRTSYVQLVRLKADLSDFDCYTCHTKGKPPVLRFDTNQVLVIPQEHADVVMAHGGHNRNNNCFNCHDDQNLDRLQTRDGRALAFSESPPLCGSCHGPTYRDWEAGVHGRTGGYWKRTAGAANRLLCVDCHDPHHPRIPQRQPFPGPHALRHETAAFNPSAH